MKGHTLKRVQKLWISVQNRERSGFVQSQITKHNFARRASHPFADCAFFAFKSAWLTRFQFGNHAPDAVVFTACFPASTGANCLPSNSSEVLDRFSRKDFDSPSRARSTQNCLQRAAMSDRSNAPGPALDNPTALTPPVSNLPGRCKETGTIRSE